MCNINNGTERINGELKYKDLNWCVNLPISELLTIVIEEFLPMRYERYVQISSVFKKYQYEILSYLRNHPRIIVEDILNKAKHISAAMIESAQPMPTVPETTFLVRGDHTDSTEIKL